jgi:hypothetical protein
MPIRMAFNVAYAVLATGLDGEQRADLDDQIYGLSAENERANRALQHAMTSGGED